MSEHGTPFGQGAHYNLWQWFGRRACEAGGGRELRGRRRRAGRPQGGAALGGGCPRGWRGPG
eukprot:5937959-Lingulodinium_polyedra.AAC.1